MRLIALLLTLAAATARAETKVYTVKGMHCGDCVTAVKAKVCKIPGIASCKVEMNKVTLEGDILDDNKVKSAVDGAGYSVSKVSVGTPAEKPTKAK